jgi:hypothetical protein
MRGSVVLALAVVLAVVTRVAPHAAALVQVSSDPYLNPECQHATQVEPDTFSFGSTAVAAFQSGRCFDGGASNIGFATTQDGGLTWTRGFLPSLTVHSDPPGPYDRASDPTVAYDAAHGVWMISSLGLSVTTSGVIRATVVASRSADGGLTWGASVVVSAAAGNNRYDKNWTACDNWLSSPFYGTCYTTWDDVNAGARLFVSTSTDGGVTWSPKTSPDGNPTGFGGIPVARPDGTVIVPASNAGGTAIMAFRSTNGGATWTQARRIAPVIKHTVAGNLRVFASLSSADVDATGKVYVVWADCRFRPGCASNDLVMSTSSDGLQWTSVVRIPIDPTTSSVDHFLPGLAVDPATSGGPARLALTYYFYPDASCTETTCQLFVGFVSSADGGATWTAPQTLAGPVSLTSLAETSLGRMVGDYISTSFVAGGDALLVFALADPPVGSVFDEAMFAEIVTPAAVATPQARRVEPGEPVMATRSDRAVPGKSPRCALNGVPVTSHDVSTRHTNFTFCR